MRWLMGCLLVMFLSPYAFAVPEILFMQEYKDFGWTSSAGHVEPLESTVYYPVYIFYRLYGLPQSQIAPYHFQLYANREPDFAKKAKYRYLNHQGLNMGHFFYPSQTGGEITHYEAYYWFENQKVAGYYILAPFGFSDAIAIPQSKAKITMNDFQLLTQSQKLANKLSLPKKVRLLTFEREKSGWIEQYNLLETEENDEKIMVHLSSAYYPKADEETFFKLIKGSFQHNLNLFKR